MKPIEVVQLRPFRSDGWKSIERYGRLIAHLNNPLTGAKRFSIISWTPPEIFKWLGNFLGRRVFYTIASSRYRDTEVIHILDAAYSNLLAFLPKQRTVVTCHDTEIWRSTNFFNRSLRVRLLKNLSQSACVVTPSNVVAGQLKLIFKENHLKLPPIKVIANGVDPIFRPSSDSNLRSKFSISNSWTLLYVANTHWPRKNFLFLLDVIAALKVTNADFNLIHLGPALRADQKSELQNRNLIANWRTFSNVSDAEVVNLYQLSDLVLIPSTYEGFGYPLIESSACGTPFLASNIETFQELLEKESELLNFDPKLWANKIKLFFTDEGFRNQLCLQAKSLEAKYTLASHLKEYESLYESIAKNSDRI